MVGHTLPRKALNTLKILIIFLSLKSKYLFCKLGPWACERLQACAGVDLLSAYLAKPVSRLAQFMHAMHLF